MVCVFSFQLTLGKRSRPLGRPCGPGRMGHKRQLGWALGGTFRPGQQGRGDHAGKERLA